MKTIELSVHQLVDFVLRKGNIDSRSFNALTMQEGTKIHNIYQSKQGANYLKEYPLRATFTFDDYLIFLSGRADGIYCEKIPIIEEIKSTNQDLNVFYEENKEWHLGQSICYAYLYCLEKNLDEISIRLTYISQKDDDILKKDFHFKKEELLAKILEYFSIYFRFQSVIEVLQEKREKSLEEIEFPFEKERRGQEKLIEFAQETCEKVECRFAEASTGIGKTMATIFSTLKFFKNKKIDKTFYLCPKNINFENFKYAFKILSDYGYELSYVEIQARSKMCPYNLEKACNPDECPLTIGYYTKLKDALTDIFTHEKLLSSKTIKRYAKKYEMCPFELSLDVSSYVDFLVCDYNYVFHPISYLRRFFDAPDKTYKIFALVDEAHNLIDRSRDMYSAVFYSSGYEILKKEIKDYKSDKLKKIIKKINADLKLFKQFDFSRGEILLEAIDSQFMNNLTSLRNEVNILEAENSKLKLKKSKDFLIDLYKFITIYSNLNEGYRIILDLKEDNLTIKFFCIDASSYLNKILYRFIGTLFFSATLTPIDYFEEATLNKNDLNFISIPSPFDENNFLLMINDNISIKYKDRDKTISEVVNEINAYINSKVGNYLVYLPSFEYLNKIKDFFKDDERFIFQKPEMSHIEKEEFLYNFEYSPKNTKVGFCVISGSFAEGIDLVGNRLIGVVIVGVGLPQVNFENNLIKDYYSSKDINGYEFAYTNPGINKIFQALGRVVRTENDRGSALIIDSRYKQTNYKKAFLSRYKNSKIVSSTSEIEEALKSFYKN